MRLLPPLSRGRRADARARDRRLPLLDRVAADPAGGAWTRESRGAGLLRPAARRAARERHPPVRDAVSLGPAAGARGSRRLAEPRHRRRLRRVHRDRRRPARRPGRALDHAERAARVHVGGLRERTPRPRPDQRGRRAGDVAPSPARPRPRGRDPAARRSGREGRHHARPASGLPGQRERRRQGGREADGRAREPLVPRSDLPRRVPGGHRSRASTAARRRSSTATSSRSPRRSTSSG